MQTIAVLAATIIFQGLVLHVQTDTTTNAKRAVLVDVKPSHNPRLIVPHTHRVSASGNWTVVQTGSNTRPWIYDLSNERLQVTGATGTTVTQTSSFDDRVPHLRDVLTGTDDLHPQIKNGSAHVNGKTATYLDYTGGTLDVKACYIKAGEYVPRVTGDPRCFAREVQFTPTVEGNWEIRDVDDQTKTIVLRRNAVVRVENDSHHGQGQHQKHYSAVLANNTPVRDLKDSDLGCSATACVLTGIRQPTFGASIQCSNNQWP